MRARPFEAARLRAAGHRPLGPGVSIGARRARCAGAASNEAPGGAVSALRLQEDSRVPETRRSWHEPAPGAPPVAPGGAATAPQEASPARGHITAAACAGIRSQPRLGLRLRVRRQRERPADQVSHRHRRVHPRMPGHRRRRLHPIQPRDRSS